MASGVTAKVLHVDLTTRQTRVEEIPEVTVRKYLGGGALACHLLLRDAGFEGVTIRGRSETPVYLWIKDGQVEFRDGAQYWGKLSGEVQDGLEAELGDKRIRVLQTGIAGERGVRFAAIVNQLKHFH